METFVYWIARGVVGLLQALPLELVARLGQIGGNVAYFLDGRHRDVALQNLAACFPEKSLAAVRALARENFRHIGEAYACGVKTAGMPWDDLKLRVEFVGIEKLRTDYAEGRPRSRVVAIGHFGNFEIYARIGQFESAFRSATTYRGLRQPRLNQLLQSMRTQSGCLFFERRSDGAALKAAISEHGFMLGLLADQSAGARGVRLNFLGRECSCSSAPAVLALRYRCRLHTAVCYRVGLARWRIEAGDEIPLQHAGLPRSTEDITKDINRAFEVAVRRDPVNWFWVHNRWKPVLFRRPTPAAPPTGASPDHSEAT